MECTNEEAEEYVEQQQAVLDEELKVLLAERDALAATMAKAKVVLYGKFGKQINLEINLDDDDE